MLISISYTVSQFSFGPMQCDGGKNILFMRRGGYPIRFFIIFFSSQLWNAVFHFTLITSSRTSSCNSIIFDFISCIIDWSRNHNCFLAIKFHANFEGMYTAAECYMSGCCRINIEVTSTNFLSDSHCSRGDGGFLWINNELKQSYNVTPASQALKHFEIMIIIMLIMLTFSSINDMVSQLY